MCRITAKYADGWLPLGLTPQEYSEKLNVIREECFKTGRNFEEIERGVFLHLIVDEDREECIRLMSKSPLIKAGALLTPSTVYEKLGYQHPLGRSFNPLTDYVPARYGREEIMKAIENIPLEVVQESFIWGNVEDIIDKLDKYRKAGVQTVVFWNFTFFGDATKVKSSYSCLDKIVDYFSQQFKN